MAAFPYEFGASRRLDRGNMAEARSEQPRYTAFLSYSHKDAAAAGRLHRRLEGYRMPRRLVGKDGARGPVPERLWPIFRDRDELPAATDLSETVREALAQSGALIVLCSPSAAQSLWVAEEIKVFRELHPDRPILAAVVDGDPPDSFPAALRAFGRDGTWHEPLATDLRPQADGPRLGLLKLVAGITGVGLDDLVQRDATRRIRRVTAVTMVAVAAMLVMAVLTVIALNARAEAERQRAAAEGLIEFMLTDLRDRLRGVGRLDVMESVNARALHYYEGQRDPMTLPQSLVRHARVLQAIGDNALARHDLPGALTAFRQAYQITAEQLRLAPSDPDRILAHTKSILGIGRVYEIREDWPMAQRYYAAFAAAADRLVVTQPNNPDFMMKAASSAVDLGNVQLNGTRDYRAAQASYERAVIWFGRAARARPTDLHVLLAQANAYGWLADSYFVRRLWRQSLAARLRQYAIVAPLHCRDLENADIRFRLAAAQRGVAYSYFQLGDSHHAQAHLTDAYEIAVYLGLRDSRNAEWRTLRQMLSQDFQRLNVESPTVAMVRSMQVDRSRHENCQADMENVDTPRNRNLQ